MAEGTTDLDSFEIEWLDVNNILLNPFSLDYSSTVAAPSNVGWWLELNSLSFQGLNHAH